MKGRCTGLPLRTFTLDRLVWTIDSPEIPRDPSPFHKRRLTVQSLLPTLLSRLPESPWPSLEPSPKPGKYNLLTPNTGSDLKPCHSSLLFLRPGIVGQTVLSCSPPAQSLCSPIPPLLPREGQEVDLKSD